MTRNEEDEFEGKDKLKYEFHEGTLFFPF